MPLYVATIGTTQRLVEAKNRGTARAYVCRDTIKIANASAAEAHKLASAGVKIESAIDDGQARVDE